MSGQDTGLHVSGPGTDDPDRTSSSIRPQPRAGRRLARVGAIVIGAATGLAIAVFLLMDSPLLQTLIWGSPAPRPTAHSLLPGGGPGAGLAPRDVDRPPGSGLRDAASDPGSNGLSANGSGPVYDSGPGPMPWQASGSSDPRRPADGQRDVTVPGQQAGIAAGSDPRAHDHDQLPASSRGPVRTGDGTGDARGQSAGRPRDLLPADLLTGSAPSAATNSDRVQSGAGTTAVYPRGGAEQAAGSAAGTGPLAHSAAVPGSAPGTAAMSGTGMAPGLLAGQGHVVPTATGDGSAAGAAAVTESANPSGTRGPSLLADLEAMQVRAFRLRMLLEENTLRTRICEASKPAFRPVWCIEAPPAPAIAAAPPRAPHHAAVPPAPELLGVAGSRSALAALLRLEGRTLRLREGERAGAWRVNRIGADGAVTLSHPSGRRVDLRVGG